MKSYVYKYLTLQFACETVTTVADSAGGTGPPTPDSLNPGKADSKLDKTG
jgi:hypothetical protein